jgi:hypothetical protein
MVYPVAAPVSAYTPGSSITYTGGFVVAEAVSANVSWNRADGHFYGDDVELDTDNGVLGYTISFEPTGLSASSRQKLLGETVSSNEYTITDAASPDLGFGYIRVMRVKGTTTVTTSYEAWWYKKLKFAISSEETRTKEQNIEWRVPTLEGTGCGVSLDSTGVLSFAQHKTFDTLAQAKSYLNGLAGIT